MGTDPSLPSPEQDFYTIFDMVFSANIVSDGHMESAKFRKLSDTF